MTMSTLGRWRLPRVLLGLAMMSALSPVPSFAQETAESPPASDAEALATARELIKTGDYDSAIESLDGLLGRAQGNTKTLRDAYLLLIKTYVFMGNELRFKPQGREASKLHYEAARARTEECLGIHALRHTHPEPASEYPQEMITIFAEVRGRIFGSFRVVSLEPGDAVVTLDGDTLGPAPGDAFPGDVDLAVGPHLVSVSRDGYREVQDEVTISSGATLEKSYALSRTRTVAWYATAIGATLGVVGGLVALLAGGGGGTQSESPLPEAPPPPSN